MSRLSIVILNYKKWEDTIKELELCHDILHVSYSDIIVVDNASPNDSVAKLKEYFEKKDVVLLCSEENHGYASGNNIGLKYSYDNGYEYAFIMNNDIEFSDSNLAENLISVMKKDDSVAVVNPDVLSPTGYLYNRDSVKPTFWDYTLGIRKYKKKGRQLVDLGGYGYVYRPQGCCMLLDLKKAHEVDYLDEHTFLYVEEPIFAERLLKKKYKCACCVENSIIHNHSITVKDSFQKKKIRQINNDSFSYYLIYYRHFSRLAAKICCIVNSLKMIFLERER